MQCLQTESGVYQGTPAWERCWELYTRAWRNINVVLDMSHQTPFPNELRKWSTIWPHLQHLDYTNILQLHLQGAPGRLPCVTGLNLLWCGDCSVLGVCCFGESNCKSRSINTYWEKSGGSVAVRKGLTDRLQLKCLYLCLSKAGGKQEGNKC